jgi:NAD(P)-dependent dehydrogenase (short-subunit alcohol dehydrogenase family)
MILTEKVLIVTGGASGIGRAVVLELLKHGAKVCALDINKKGLE